jgi:ribosomal protein RSM22 (predicted rRNA methylase)
MSLVTKLPKVNRPASFLYDRLPRAPTATLSPTDEIFLDELAFQSMRTVDLPAGLKDRALALLRAYPNKKDLEKYGAYFFRKVRARACAETPRVLGSSLLPEKIADSEKTQLEKLLHGRGFAELAEVIEDLELKKDEYSEILSFAIHDGADALFKLFQTVYTYEACLVYLAHKFPSVYATNFRILSEISRRLPHLEPKKILDYGAGPGTAALAAHRIWSSSIESTVLVEPAAQMRQIGQQMVGNGSETSGHVRWISALYDDSTPQTNELDLVLLSNVLMEVKTQEQRDNLVRDLWRRLAPDGLLVVVERGTPTGFRYIHKIRENFISKITNFHFVAPCPHESACPLALTGRDWCHFSQNFQPLPGFSRATAEKFSYLVIRKSVGPRQKFRHEVEVSDLETRSFFWPRVVMPPIMADGHTLIDVCSAPNNFQRLVVNRAKPHIMGYRQSREAMWGDLWRWPKRLARAEAREYVPDEVKAYIDRMKKVAMRALSRVTQEESSNSK